MHLVRLLPCLLALLLLSPPVFAGQYNYISAERLEQLMRQQEPLTIVDIQVEPEFSAAHIKGARPTPYAFPVKTEQDQAKLDAIAATLASNDTPVVIVPRGAGGAERTFQYLAAKGIALKRLHILEKGQAGWNCSDLTERK